MLQKELSTNTQQQLERQFKYAKLNVRYRLHETENTWWSDLASEMKITADKKNIKELYDLMKQAFGPRMASVIPLSSKDGMKLLTSMDTSNKWKKCF